MNLRLIRGITLSIIFVFVHNVITAQETLFYMQGTTLYRYTLPSGPEISLNLGSGGHSGLVFDNTNQKLYWKSGVLIKSVPADFNVSTTITTELNIFTDPNAGELAGPVLDEPNNDLYMWEYDFDTDDEVIVKYDLDDANPASTRNVAHRYPSTGSIRSISVDSANDRIYYSVPNQWIRYVTLDGNNQTDLITFTNSDRTRYLKKDPYNDRVLFGNGDGTTVVTLQSIPTSGGSVTTLISQSTPAGGEDFDIRPFDLTANGDIFFGVPGFNSSFDNVCLFLSANLMETPPVATSTVTGTSFSSSFGFVNIAVGTIGSPVPSVAIQTITASSTTIENSGTLLKYQFTLSTPAAATTTVNFTISGTAADGDYTVTTGGSGQVTYDASMNKGTIEIAMGATTTDLMIVPNADGVTEETETIIVSVAAP